MNFLVDPSDAARLIFDLEDLKIPAPGLESQGMGLYSNLKVVYVLQAKHGGPVKIGRSTYEGIKSRMKSVQTGHPHPLEIKCVLRDDGSGPIVSGQLEGYLHDTFKEARLEGEWFLPDDPLVTHLGVNGFDDEIEELLRRVADAGREQGIDLGRREAEIEADKDLAGILFELVRERGDVRKYLIRSLVSTCNDEVRRAQERYREKWLGTA